MAVRRQSRPRDERGSAVAEFAMVAMLLTLLALGVIQLALALHVRNTVLDAAAEGARFAALAGVAPEAGAARTRELISTAVGAGYATEIEQSRVDRDGVELVRVTVRAALPVLGLFGPPASLEVSGHAVREAVG
ncbi:TadE/TadG family type IV pilus assembly protein [Agromyces mediolanus]|uniref:TadE/TadG family type IV pilus assembly protein n=1 Tax=Agromyces mediolanus TaxID=41986 RepID=UPI0027DF34ED|nr:pilus assembly protein [Agromyces mediolanus]